VESPATIDNLFGNVDKFEWMFKQRGIRYF
jgi:hypothetical protein